MKTEDRRLTFEIFSKYRGALMGLAILSIIALHFSEDCYNFDVHYIGVIRWYREMIGSSGVDVFLCLSGMGLFYSFRKNRDRRAFYARRFIRILVPYFIVAIPVLTYRYGVCGGESAPQVIRDLLFVSFFTKGKTPYWYIFMILVCYYIFPAIYRIFDEAATRSAEWIRLAVLLALPILVSIQLEQYASDFFSNINVMMLRFPAFFLGVYLGKLAYEKREIHVWDSLIAIGAICFLNYAIDTSRVIVNRFEVITLTFAIFFAIAVGLEKLKYKKVLLKILETIGKYTLELYLVHVSVRSVMKLVGYPTCYGRNELIMLVISVVLSLVLHLVSDRITGALQKRR